MSTNGSSGKKNGYEKPATSTGRYTDKTGLSLQKLEDGQRPYRSLSKWTKIASAILLVLLAAGLSFEADGYKSASEAVDASLAAAESGNLKDANEILIGLEKSDVAMVPSQ